MAIRVSQAFERTSANAIDGTLTLTKAQMLTVNDNLMPNKYLTICQDDGALYLYDKSATASVTTGKFKKFEGGDGQVIQVDDMPTASAEEKDKIYQYIGGTDEDYINGYFYKCVKTGNPKVQHTATRNNDNRTNFNLTATVAQTVTFTKTGGYNLFCYYLNGTQYPSSGNYQTNGTVTVNLQVGDVLQATFSQSASIGCTITYYVDETYYTWESIKVQEGTEYTAGDGIDIDNTEISVKTMTAEDLQDVKDAFAINQGAPARMFNYSTDEQVVGTWIDGKPIYQKTITGTFPSTASTSIFGVGAIIATNINEIVDYKGKATYLGSAGEKSLTQTFPVLTIGLDQSTKIWGYTDTSDNLKLYGVNSNQSFANRPFVFTIQYTKTTD